MTARPWYADQDPRIVGVILLAEARQVISVDEWALIVATFAPANAEVLSDIADALPKIDALTNDKSAETLAVIEGPGAPRHLFPSQSADALLAELRRDVVMWASGVASLARAGAA